MVCSYGMLTLTMDTLLMFAMLLFVFQNVLLPKLRKCPLLLIIEE